MKDILTFGDVMHKKNERAPITLLAFSSCVKEALHALFLSGRSHQVNIQCLLVPLASKSPQNWTKQENRKSSVDIQEPHIRIRFIMPSFIEKDLPLSFHTDVYWSLKWLTMDQEFVWF